MPAVRRISQTADCATVTPSLVTSPWIRRYPHSGFSFASRTMMPAMLANLTDRNADGGRQLATRQAAADSA